MSDASVDVLVIGGGIHGAGIAQAAAAHGYTVLVLEKSELASATSSKSSKLIHGGLRYLETFQFHLVKECLRERALLLRNAPDLVRLVPFYIPVYQHTRRRPWKIRVGLNLYSWLNSDPETARFKNLPSSKWGWMDGLNHNKLQAIFQYYDAQTDDVALTRAVMNSAKNLGAECLTKATFESASIKKSNCLVQYSHEGKQHEVSCSVLVNAAGPWVNEVIGRIGTTQQTMAVDLVQGSHILLNVPEKSGVFYLEARKDRRAVFVMPWKGLTMVGTTEKVFDGNPEQVSCTDEESNYLLDNYLHYFPGSAGNTPDITDSFAGLRVLLSSKDDPNRRDRDTHFLCNNERTPRLVSIYGGKLTAYRSTAENLIQKIKNSLPERRVRADTKTLKLVAVE